MSSPRSEMPLYHRRINISLQLWRLRCHLGSGVAVLSWYDLGPSTSLEESRVLPLVNAGVISSTPKYVANSLCMVNHLSTGPRSSTAWTLSNALTWLLVSAITSAAVLCFLPQCFLRADFDVPTYGHWLHPNGATSAGGAG